MNNTAQINKGYYEDSSGIHFYNVNLPDEKLNKKPLMQGWQCPVCGKVYSPYVDICQNEFCGIKVSTRNPDRIDFGYTD